MCSRSVVCLSVVVAVAVIVLHTVNAAPNVLRDEMCGHNLTRPSGFFHRHFDGAFLKKFFTHWIPFKSNSRVKMHFYLYKRDFPECGREIITDNTDSLYRSGFDAKHQTRIIIHGWMSQSKGSFNRAVKDAYLSLTTPPTTENETTTISNDIPDIINTITNDTEEHQSYQANEKAETTYVPSDFNVIVVDWSVISSNVNYFGVVELIEDLGFHLAEFLRFLHMHAGLHFDDVYLIGHSLGAQIAGSAGKQLQPLLINTIFALDPAGPKFRNQSHEYRIDPSDARYVESIQTSGSLGFTEPVGHATFYPNYGRDQKKCYFYGCSHSRAHHYFAESLTSTKGFWGTECQRLSEDEWILSDSGLEFKMGGEPSTPKNGTFYVKTNAKRPYAMGRRRVRVLDEPIEQQS